MPINGGLLIFRDSDAKDRTATLILHGALTQGDNNQRILTPASLLFVLRRGREGPLTAIRMT